MAGVGYRVLGAGSPAQTDVFLLTLFAALEREGVRYAVLHSWEGLPEEFDSDLDVAVHPEDAGGLRDVFRLVGEAGYRLTQHFPYAVGADYYVFTWFEGTALRSAGVDVIQEHRRGGWILASGEALVAGRRRHGAFWVSSAATEFRYLLAKRTLKQSWSVATGERLHKLAEELGFQKAWELAEELFGAEGAEALAAGRVGELRPALGRTQFRQRPWEPVRCAAAEAWRLVRRWFRPTGLTVALLGPDAAGKSTLLSALVTGLSGTFRRHRVYHFRPGLLGRRRTGPVTDPHGRPAHGGWRSAARLALHAADYWLAYWLAVRPLVARSGLVIFDRDFRDLTVDPKRYRYGGPRWLAQAVARLIPRPEVMLVLDAPAEVLLDRRQEVGLEEARRLRGGYLRLALAQERAHLVRASRPAAEVAAEALGIVTGYLGRRLEPEPVREATSDLVETAQSRLGGGENGRRRTYAAVPSRAVPRWLLPLGEARLTARGLSMYTPYTPAARALKAALAAVVRTGWEGWAQERVEARAENLESLVGEVLEERRPVFAVSLGSGGRYRKLTVQVMRPDGRVLGYVKLPLGEDAAGRVRSEARTLERLAGCAALRGRTPRLLWAGEWNGGYALVQGPCPGEPGPARLGSEHRRFLEVLWGAHRVARPGPEVIAEVAADWDRWTGTLETKWHELGAAALELAGRELQTATLRCGIAHGDFAPWNTRVARGRLVVFDWEAAEWEAPAAWDLYHFETQTAALLGKNHGRRPAVGERAVFLLYLLRSIGRLLEEGSDHRRETDYRKRLLAREMAR